MESKIIHKWERNKDTLRNHLESYSAEDVRSLELEDIIDIFLRQILNGYDHNFSLVFSERAGSYQGDIITIFKENYADDINEYYCTCVAYGSCSHCDTLYSITNYIKDEVTKEDIDGLMTLFLHLAQQTKCLGNLFKLNYED